MFKGSLIAVIACTMFISVSCCKKIVGNEGKSTNQEKNLYQTTWILTKINSKKVVREEGQKPITLFIDAESKNVSGYAGCNRIVGSRFEESKGVIKFGALATTKMFCPDNNIEDNYLRTLDKVDNYVIQANELQLRKGENVLLIFIAEE